MSLRALSSIALFSVAVVCTPVGAVTLYDPGLGTLPVDQGWVPASSGTGATQSLVGGRLRSDTITDANAVVLVQGLTSPEALNTVTGFTLNFGLQVLSETHQSVNRSGYSVLVQGLDQSRAIELEFWEDRVWALDYLPGGADGGYVQGASGLLDTTASFRQYALTVQNNQYTLLADGNLLLQGAMVDYPTVSLETAVYGFSNTLVFGDNSTRGQSLVDLGLVSVTAVPEAGTLWMLLSGVGVLAWRCKAAVARDRC